MKPVRFHSWNVEPNEAEAIQNNLRQKVLTQPIKNDIQYIGGTAVSIDTVNNMVHAALVILNYPGLGPVEQHGISQEIRFDYMSGLLTFREGAPLMSLFRRVVQNLDLVLFHAHGQAHPRRFGLASHLGVLLDVPSIGISNKILVGHHVQLSNEKFSIEPIIDGSEEIGMALRSRENKSPIFISTGHKTDLESSVRLVKSLVKKYKTPEPIRLAQLSANKQKDGEDIEAIKAKTEALVQSSLKLGEAIYKQNPQGGAPQPDPSGEEPSSDKKEEKVVDADFEEVDENKKD